MILRRWVLTPIIFIMSISLVKAELLVEETVSLPEYNARQVIVLLEPYLHPEGILAGDGNELYIKTTPENLKVLKEELKKIAPLGKNLRIYVTMDPAIVESTLNNRVAATTPRETGNRTYYVDSVEGQWATIQISTRHPVRERYKTERGTIAERVIYKGVSAGFRVLPLIENNSLILKVKAINETAQVDTVVSGPLNSWINLGGSTHSTQGNTLAQTRREGLRSHMAIKVEPIEKKAASQGTPHQ